MQRTSEFEGPGMNCTVLAVWNLPCLHPGLPKFEHTGSSIHWHGCPVLRNLFHKWKHQKDGLPRPSLERPL